MSKFANESGRLLDTVLETQFRIDKVGSSNITYALIEMENTIVHRTQTAHRKARDNFISALQLIDSMAELNQELVSSIPLHGDTSHQIPTSIILEMVRKAAATFWESLETFETFDSCSGTGDLQVLSVQIQRQVPMFERDSPLIQDESLANITGILSSIHPDDEQAAGRSFVSIGFNASNVDTGAPSDAHVFQGNGSISIMNIVSPIVSHCRIEPESMKMLSGKCEADPVASAFDFNETRRTTFTLPQQPSPRPTHSCEKLIQKCTWFDETLKRWSPSGCTTPKLDAVMTGLHPASSSVSAGI